MLVENLKAQISARLMMIASRASVHTAARALLDHNIGLLVVCGDVGEVVGVLSRLDLLRHLADGQAGHAVDGIMSTDIVSCRLSDDLRDAWKLMASHSLRSLPVLGIEARPVGVLDLQDLLKALFEEEEYQEQLLEHYIAGLGYH